MTTSFHCLIIMHSLLEANMSSCRLCPRNMALLEYKYIDLFEWVIYFYYLLVPQAFYLGGMLFLQ